MSTKVIYKKNKFSIAPLPNRSFDEIDENSVVQKLNSLTAASSSPSSLDDYIELYDALFHNITEEKLEKISTKISEELNNFLNSKVNEITSSNLEEHQKLSEIFTAISEISDKIEKIKALLTNSKVRFDLKLSTALSSKVSADRIWSSFLSSHSELVSKMETFLLSLFEKSKTDFLRVFMPYRSHFESSSNKIIDEILKKILLFYTEEIKNIEITTFDEFVDYFKKYTQKIDEEVLFWRPFGDTFSNVLNEELIDAILVSKLTNSVYQNNTFISKLIQEKNLSIMSSIEVLSRKKKKTMKLYENLIFDEFYNYFLTQVASLNEDKASLSYVVILFDNVKFLTEILTEVFRNSFGVRHKYNEILTKMINTNSQKKNFEFILSLFISKNISNQNLEELLSFAMGVIIKGLNFKDEFMFNMRKMLFKRISTFSFDIKKEEQLCQYLMKNLENKYTHQYSRMISDINFSFKYTNLENFFLFSNKVLHSNDLSKIIDTDKEGPSFPFFESFEKYKTDFPHRIITLSQTRSSALVTFTKPKVSFVVNFVQAKVLEAFNENPSRPVITYKELVDRINAKTENLPIFRICLISLIKNGILEKGATSEDIINSTELKPNFNFVPNDKLNIFEETLSLIVKSFKEVSAQGKGGESDINTEKFSAFVINKKHIIQCKIMRKIKQGSPNPVGEIDVVKEVVTDNKIKELFKDEIDILYIRGLIEELVNRNFISSIKEENKVFYKYN